jgi:hypothetical protein
MDASEMWLSTCVGVGSGQRVDAIIPMLVISSVVKYTNPGLGGSDNATLDQSLIDGLLCE